MHRTNIAIVLSCMLTAPTALAAQDDGAADIEGGVTEAGSVELGVEASAEGSASGAGTSSSSTGSTSTSSSLQSSGGGSYSSSGSSGGTRLALQLRLDVINVLEAADDGPNQGPGDSVVLGGNDGGRLLVPMATPGVRLLDERLFLGLGLGFQSVSAENGNNESSRSGFSFSPGASYDVIANDMAALSLGGFFNLALLGETEDCDPDCSNDNDDATGVGLTLLAGLRGKLSPALAIGGEFGWGFMSISVDSGTDIFVHGITGILLFEASVGL